MISAHDIALFEHTHAVTLPTAYQQLLFHPHTFNGPLYGLFPLPTNDLLHPLSQLPYSETLQHDFPFDQAWLRTGHHTCQPSHFLRASYGSVAIATEGCNIFWILILKGRHQGEVWLVNPTGVTPCGANASIERWIYRFQSQPPQWWQSLLSPEAATLTRLLHPAQQKILSDATSFHVPTALCLDCIGFIRQHCRRYHLKRIITDPKGTYYFYKDGTLDFLKAR